MTGSISGVMDDALSKAGKKTLEKGITYGQAVYRAFMREIRPKNLLEDVCTEAISNFNSWFTETTINGTMEALK